MRHARQFALAVAASLLTGVCAPARAEAQADPSPAVLRIALSAPTAIPEGTVIPLTLRQTLASQEARAGEPVAFAVAGDVRTPDGRYLLIPAGAPAVGVVEAARGAGPFGRPGTLRLRCDFVQLADGTRVPLRLPTYLSGRGRSQKGAAVVSGVLVGAGVGFVVLVGETVAGIGSGDTTTSPAPLLLGVGSGFLISALWRGGNVTLPAGKTFEAAAAQDTPLGALPAAPEQTTRP